tara:strand:+ start:327 stop:485 length:159 start_codon:yes stop_codon:yes gene_type:complete
MKDQSSDISAYIKQLNDLERIVLNIAQEHLGSSFQITKSIGFINWKRTQEIK